MNKKIKMSKVENNIERTLVLIKPDGVSRGLVGEIIKRFEIRGLKIVGLKLIRANVDLIGRHYKHDPNWLKSVGAKSKAAYAKRGVIVKKEDIEIGEDIRNLLMEYIGSGPVVAMVLEGPHAVEVVKKIVGPTEPRSAPVGTIRGDFSTDSYMLSDELRRPIKNIIHCSGSIEEADDEISVWFSPNEIYSYERADESVAYRRTW